MADVTDSAEFFWDVVVFKVEDTLFRVPRCEFEQSSEVFADMFRLPSGDADQCEGCNRDNPIALKGYTSAEFTCLLKVMYPRGSSLIPVTYVDFGLTKEEWVSVLKLTTIWNVKQIREHAIQWLNGKLMPIEKIQLARAYKVANWFPEGLISLIYGDHKLTSADIPSLGWQTSTHILLIRDNRSSSSSNIYDFSVKCRTCPSSSIPFSSGSCYNYGCHSVMKLTFAGRYSASDPEIDYTSSPLRDILCSSCNKSYYSSVHCPSCKRTFNLGDTVKVVPGWVGMFNNFFGEIKEYQLGCSVDE